jgi:hypothetical protein
MGHLTHKRKKNRRGVTRRVQSGGLFGKSFSQLDTDAKYEKNMKQQLADDKNDKHIGVLLSVKSLNSTDQKIKGTPYVVIVPYRENGEDKTKYAYGSTADGAVKNAMNKIFDDERHAGDTYTGTAISYRSLFSTDPKLKNEPYVINIGGTNYRGTTPANAVAKAAQTNASAVFGRGLAATKSAFSRKGPAAVAPAAAAPAAAAPAAAAPAGAHGPPAPAPASAHPPAHAHAHASAHPPASAHASAHAHAHARAPAHAPAHAHAHAPAPAPTSAPAPLEQYEWPDGSMRPTPPP